MPYETIGEMPNLLKSFEKDLQISFKKVEEDLIIAQAKLQDLKTTIESVESPSEAILKRKRDAEQELEKVKTIITERLTQKFEVVLRWMLQEWSLIKLAPYKLPFDLSMAVSAFFDHLDHLENRFGLKGNPVRRNLVESISKDCDEEAIFAVVAQEEAILHSREEMDMETAKILAIDDQDFPSSTFSSRNTIPGIPVQSYKPGQTMRPTFEPSDEARKKYEESLKLQQATAQRLGKPMAPWSPAKARQDEVERQAVEEGIATITTELTGKLIPKTAPLPSFENLIAPTPENTEEAIPEAPKTKPAIPRTLPPRPEMQAWPEISVPRLPSAPEVKMEVPVTKKDTTPVLPPAPASKKKSVWGRVAASVGVLAMTGLAVFGLNKSKSPTEQTDTVQSAVATASAAPSSAPRLSMIEETSKPAPTVTVQPPAPKLETKPEVRTFAKVLTESKSPIIQDILNKGETKLLIKNGTIVGMFIDSFQGLTNDKQKVEMKELERMINLGIGVYFNEHFGDKAKVDAIMKGTDQKMKNLYRTAKYAQDKGWINSGLTKGKFPEAYAFAEMILKDASDLRMDESDNPDQKVQAFVTGNMFQAKMIGSNLKTRKANGEDHVILECIYKIFEGKDAREALKQVQAARAAKKAVEVVKPAPVPQMDKQLNQGPNNGQNGVILPNIISPGQMDKQTADLKLIEEVDAGWDEIDEQQEVLEFERELFEKSNTVDFQLPMGLNKQERSKLIIPKVADEVARLYPQADQQKVCGLIKQWGYIGFAGVKDDGYKVEVRLHPNFMKVLKMVLNKKVTANS